MKTVKHYLLKPWKPVLRKDISMHIYSLTQGYIDTNIYIVEHDGHFIIIDPEGPATTLFKAFNELQGKPEAILLTHGHFDHVGAVEDLVATYHIPVYASKDEIPLLNDPDMNLSSQYGLHYHIHVDHELVNNEELDIIGLHIRCIATPGHTEGGMCYLIGNDLFAGDTIFFESYGRYDFPTGSFEKICTSINKILELPETTNIYPGHGEATSVAHELIYNPLSKKR